MKKFLFLLSLLLCMVSCTNEDMEPNAPVVPSKLTTFTVSPEEAENELESFLNSLNTSAASTRSCEIKQIANICPIRRGTHTRSSEIQTSDNYDIDTLMYAINFADNQGFALVSADRRTTPIFALIEEGSFSIDSLSEDKDEGFLSFIDHAVNMEMNDIRNHNESNMTRSLNNNGYTISSITSPILHTKWTQDNIYGQYCPNGISGCVITATAQILSYYQTIGHVNWSYNGTMGSSDLHWAKIISDCDNNDGKLTSSSCYTSGNEIAHLVRYLGIAIGADYNKKSTSAKTSKAVEWFNKWGGLNASKLKDYNESAIITAIKSGYPVLARGNSGKKKVLGIRVGWKGGHAWIYDGVLTASKDGKTNNFIHCNWGWGGYKNGYYISKAFDTNAGASIYDYTDYQSGSSSNYKYNLEYSIVKR